MDSLTPQQRGWWTKIRDNVIRPVITGAAVTNIVNPALGALVGAVGKREVDSDLENEIDQFMDSLTPQQRGWWTKIRDNVIRPVITGAAVTNIVNPALGALVGAVGKREVDSDLENEIDQFMDSLTPQQRGWWTKIRDNVIRPVITGAAVTNIVNPALGALVGAVGKRMVDIN